MPELISEANVGGGNRLYIKLFRSFQSFRPNSGNAVDIPEIPFIFI